MSQSKSDRGNRGGRAVLVTGAAGGMGRACARALAPLGELLLQDLDTGALADFASELAAEGLRAETLAGDLCDEKHLAALTAGVAERGGLRALAHTAGVSPTMADAKRVFDVDLVASARLLDALAPQLRPGAVAVLVASQAGHLVGASLGAEIEAILDDSTRPDAHARLVEVCPPAADPGGAYGIAKRGVQRLAVHRAPEWGRAGARIVSLSPGIIDTAMGKSELDGGHDIMKQMIEKTPVGQRLGTPEEIAAVIAFLCSDAASFVSGVDWLVDGGSTWQIAGAR